MRVQVEFTMACAITRLSSLHLDLLVQPTIDPAITDYDAQVGSPASAGISLSINSISEETLTAYLPPAFTEIQNVVQNNAIPATQQWSLADTFAAAVSSTPVR
jgi:hypothetical protein